MRQIQHIEQALSQGRHGRRRRGDDVLSEMEYPHWMMVAGACLVVAGFIGLGFSRYMNRAPAEDNLHPAAPPPNSTVAGRAEGEEMSARHSSAELWKPEDDDRLRKARLASRNNGSGW